MTSEPKVLKRALVTGVTGQHGAYLADYLLGKGYVVHCISGQAPSFHAGGTNRLYGGLHAPNRRLVLGYGDLTEATNLIRTFPAVQPEKAYSFGAQSHIQASVQSPEYAGNTSALGTQLPREAIRNLGLEQTTLFYQATSCKIFGKVVETSQKFPDISSMRELAWADKYDPDTGLEATHAACNP